MRTVICAVVLGVVAGVLASVGRAQPATGELPAMIEPQAASELQAAACDLRLAVAGHATPGAEENDEQRERRREELVRAIERVLDGSPALVATSAMQVEKVAPDVWKMLVRQQYGRALGDLARPLLLVALLALYFWKFGWKWAKQIADEIDDALAALVGLALVVIIPGFFLVKYTYAGVGALSAAVKAVSNPGYYAIRDLLLLLLPS